MSSTIPFYVYLASLLFALTALVIWDYSKKIAIFKNGLAAFKVIAFSVLFFLIWDILGIILNIFHTNDRYVSGVFLFTRDLPLEEIMFLTFLSYFVLILERIRLQK